MSPAGHREFMSDDRITIFWSRTERSGKCLLWTGAMTGRGYGSFRVNGRDVPAHRVAYELTKGAIPDGLVVRHTCDTPPCVEPTHLLIGTHQDNARDKMERGRHRSVVGEDHFKAKITNETVLAIRSMRKNGLSTRSIARKIGSTLTTVAEVAKGQRWKHIGGDIVSARKPGRPPAAESRCSICDEFGHDMRRCPLRPAKPLRPPGNSKSELAARHVLEHGGTFTAAAELFGVTRSAVGSQYARIVGSRKENGTP